MIDTSSPEFIQVSWTSLLAVATPVAAAFWGAVKLLMVRADKDRDALLEQIQLQNASLSTAVAAFKEVVSSNASADASARISMAEIVQTQQRLVWAQERILALLEADIKSVSRRGVDVG
jgi:hypothetical protein